jgi:putative FmdB family regulatory protein
MPLYEYQCSACGHRFEVIQKFSDPPLEACPKCGGAVQKLQSAPAFQFKGTGWYITDYAKKDGTAKKEGAAAGNDGKDAKDGKSDTADGGARAEKSADQGADKPSPKSDLPAAPSASGAAAKKD